MIYALIVVVVLAFALHLYRLHWYNKDLEPLFLGEIDADFFANGETLIAVRRGHANAERTIICFPGFLENMRYFQDLYAQAPVRLILVNNADYHAPYPMGDVQTLDWDDNPHPIGTIEHDGFQLGQIIQSLAPTGDLVLHGHSRGGAVVLEAGRQYPALMKSGERRITALLEAAVLPQARTAGNGSDPLPHRLITYLLPIVLGMGRKAPVERLLKQPMMRPTNPLKTEICQTVYSNARHYSTCVTNVRSIRQWQLERSFDLYENYDRVVAIIGERDDVLDNDTMVASAEQGRQLNPGVEIVHTRKTNHFVSLEQPHYLLEAAGAAQTA